MKNAISNQAQLRIAFDAKPKRIKTETAASRVLKNFRRKQRLDYLLSYCGKRDKFIALNGAQVF